MDKKIDPASVGEYVAEILARERPEYNEEAVKRQQDMLAEAARTAGLSEQDMQRALDALQRGYQERTKP
jgi:hypothetical protein